MRGQGCDAFTRQLRIDAVLGRLAKFGKVTIGLGCIKYRFQTEPKTLDISEGNSQLVVEICQTFTNYFTASNGLNLGFEILERSKTKVRVFYFTDENISETEFFDRLAATERNLLNLLSSRPDLQLLIAQAPTGDALSTGSEHALINAVDGISALLSTFFRASVRIAFGLWTPRETESLLGVIDFSKDKQLIRRAEALHHILAKKYPPAVLAEFSRRQNEGFLPIGAEHQMYDFAILTVIEVERRAVCDAFGLKARVKMDDGRFYWPGDISLPNGQVYRIVVAQPLGAGSVDTAVLMVDVIRNWNPKAALLVGIAASADPDHAKLGDIVVGKSVWYYEHGKPMPDGVRPQPEMIPADAGLLKHWVGLADWDFDVPVARPDGAAAKPKLIEGVIASGEKVIADAVARDLIASGHRKIFAIEMEGYGFSRAAWQSFKNVRHLVIRGICDDGSSAKDDKWHDYAASAVAAFARHFIFDRPL